ncbi:MAG: hypothetical protein KGS61_06830 [Verrucomicrobia bacterium]|nr:hypothetical protein [Verrucomicrobiota bacterium]
MLERAEPALKGLCLALAAILLLQCGRILLRADPLNHLNLPTVPAWEPPSETKSTRPNTRSAAPPAATASATAASATNPSNRTAHSAQHGRTPGPGSRPALANPDADLPATTRQRIDRIKDSEIFGPVPRPLTQPMALLGIAGEDVFLRGPTGQTGLLRVGEQLGGAKLLQIGTNRVVVEYEGQRKELTIFSGFGSQTLLPK